MALTREVFSRKFACIHTSGLYTSNTSVGLFIACAPIIQPLEFTFELGFYAFRCEKDFEIFFFLVLANVELPNLCSTYYLRLCPVKAILATVRSVNICDFDEIMIKATTQYQVQRSFLWGPFPLHGST